MYLFKSELVYLEAAVQHFSPLGLTQKMIDAKRIDERKILEFSRKDNQKSIQILFILFSTNIYIYFNQIFLNILLKSSISKIKKTS